jgi:hypothetical protein
MQRQTSASFILRIKWLNGNVHITLQNIKTRQILTFDSWEPLFRELQRTVEEANANPPRQ